ncbi:enoyl-CoA hydratase/isomerase family protein [Rhodoplanes sp. TEM]|uniref:Enoyl-CoA hydratase/isomerase family protein n=1 Tax=Rhodoplanes tepidamans TaxID=200616 RepID=A0ABT5J3X8_RHOTP|nr:MULTISPECIES: enoyl-CoA hydratase/isomerase family protein [Rhodoplanes]MDC7784348.1 enoyl-CoA hydratase/isomerase family protein [Rhodoplanes tepidamans]MDC7983388.1 enoyl-CoA hydratase/isomerase family protein [Rhodoplanes sp. TEM]MDQ0354524.1 enoyl-CoA hydratase/carnithine racemase [Rhodoplanes tepidamans]
MVIRANYPSDHERSKVSTKAEREYGVVPHMTLAEYSERLKHCFTMKRKNGILEARLHTGGDSLQWGAPAHQGLHYFFDWAGRDPENEVIILGGTGKDFMRGIGRLDENGKWQPATEFSSHPSEAWKMYDFQYYDGTNDIEGQVFDLEVPTIGVWNGAAFHSDLVLFSDITLCTEDAWTTEMHFRVNMVPGDGIQIAWRELMGRKRYAYAELTGEIITARKALALGMVNEICPDTESCYDRAWEIAELIMRTGTRTTRRVTTQILRQAWKEDIAKELRGSFATEMFVTATEHSPHEVNYWHWAHEEAELVKAAEKKGKIIRPRIDGGREEDEIK